MMLSWDEVQEALTSQPLHGKEALTPKPPLRPSGPASAEEGEGESEGLVQGVVGSLSDPRPLAGEGGAQRRVRASSPALSAPLLFPAVSTDTRTLAPGALFVALKNANNDGHLFVAQAVERGAAALVVSQDVDGMGSVPVVRVPDTERAYAQIAAAWRGKFSIPVIGVTGSVGKTTVKEMLAAACGPLGPMLKTAASQNNETGVPKTLLQMTEAHRAAIVEMGMRGVGQIASLAAIARPTVGVITTIGDNHIELLGSRDAIAHAKGELLEALPVGGLAVLNSDSKYYPLLRGKTAARIVTYGTGSDADYRAESIEHIDGGWQYTVRGVAVQVASPSRHDVLNSLAALAVAHELGVPLGEAAQGLTQYVPPPLRMQVQAAPWGGTVLNDAYNAAPDSMRSALETLARAPGTRKWAFLGDMKELGTHGAEAHRALGTVIDSFGGLHGLYTVGELAALMPGAEEHFANSKDAADAAAHMPFMAGDVVLVKGSRAMAMERIAQALLQPRAAGSLSAQEPT